MHTWQSIFSFLAAPFRLFLQPERRVFLPYILISVLVFVCMSCFFGSKTSLKVAFNLKSIKAAFGLQGFKVDAKMLILTTYLKTIFAAVFFLSPFPLIFWFKGILTKMFGTSLFIESSNTIVIFFFSVTLFLAHDLSRFLLHFSMHKSAFLWNFHQVHHSAEYLNPLTLYRTHPVESLLYSCRSFLVNVVVTAVFLYLFSRNIVVYQFFGVAVFSVVFSAFSGNLRHSHVFLSYGKILEKVLMSPAQHQIHHSNTEELQNSNFGSWLSVWDGLFGTLICASKVNCDALSFGLLESDRNHRNDSVLSMLFSPFFFF